MRMIDGLGHWHEVPDQLYEAPEPYGYADAYGYGEPDYGYAEPEYGNYAEPEASYGYGYYGEPEYGMAYDGLGNPVGLPFLAPLLGPAISALAPAAAGLLSKITGGGGAPPFPMPFIGPGAQAPAAQCPPCPPCPACPMCAAPLPPPPPFPAAGFGPPRRRRRRY
jgi:hypothetical protein